MQVKYKSSATYLGPEGKRNWVVAECTRLWPFPIHPAAGQKVQLTAKGFGFTIEYVYLDATDPAVPLVSLQGSCMPFECLDDLREVFEGFNLHGKQGPL